MKSIFLKKTYVIVVLALAASISSCKKDWLDAKPDSQLVVPETLDDLQDLANLQGYSGGLGESGTDNFYVTSATLATQASYYTNIYLWAQKGLGYPSFNDWNTAYKQIYFCNLVFSKIGAINQTPANLAEYNNTVGSAHFWRAFFYHNMSQAFVKQYDPATAAADMGIPLRLQPDVAQIVGRGTVKGLYDQILSDALSAAGELPLTQEYFSQPTRSSAFALLSRIYLTMQDYTHAKIYADSTLKLSGSLLDYNTLSAAFNTSSAPMPQPNLNPEALVYAYGGVNVDQYNIAEVDSNLYRSYGPNDLRKKLFFLSNSTGIHFRGSYSGILFALWGGPCTDEIYLTRAECNARAGNTSEAMNDLNTVLIKRWLNGTFIAYTASNANDALAQILTERRKELCFRCIRWSDLRRLNTDPRFAVTITRIVNGVNYTLSPGSNWYVWPIPDNEIIYSGIPNNPR